MLTTTAAGEQQQAKAATTDDGCWLTAVYTMLAHAQTPGYRRTYLTGHELA